MGFFTPSQYLCTVKNGSKNNSLSLLLHLVPRKGSKLTLCTVRSITMAHSWRIVNKK